MIGKEKGRHNDVAVTPATPACLHPTKLVGSWHARFNEEAKTYPVNKSVNYVNVQKLAISALIDANSSLDSGHLGAVEM